MVIIITFLGYTLWVCTSYSNMKEIAVQDFNRGENNQGWNPQQSRHQGLLIYDLIVINTFFSSFCNDKAFAIKTLPSFWNPQKNDKWPRPTWGGGKCSVFYIPSDLLWVWEHNWCEIKLGQGGKRMKEEEFPTKKCILPKTPRFKSHYHWCELSTLIRGSGTLEYLQEWEESQHNGPALYRVGMARSA